MNAAWQILRRDKVFWLLVALKLVLAFCCGSHFAATWFAPFLHDWGLHPLQNPWTDWYDGPRDGDARAFPYGPAMLVGVGAPWLVAAPLGIADVGHVALLLLRLPLLAADVLIALLLMTWLPQNQKTVARVWFANPIVLYATYVHGQLDLWPTALLLLAIWLILAERTRIGALVFGLAIAAKLHVLVALPFVATWLWKRRTGRRNLPLVLLVALLVGLLPYFWLGEWHGPAFGPVHHEWLHGAAFRRMVLENEEAGRLWELVLNFGNDVKVYVAPAALVLTWLRMATWRTVERDLALLVLGLAFLVLVALVPPQPGWFVWSAPFVAYFSAQFTRSARWSIRALNLMYLCYFCVALDPDWLQPWGNPRVINLAWTLLFCAIVWTAWEMTRRGISARTSARHDEVFLIGIGGDSGAGKHTLGRDILGVLGDRLALIDGDDDHRWERGDPAWQTLTHLDPRANRLQLQLAALQRLRQGADVRKPRYDHVHGRFTPPKLWPSARVVGLVGLHPFYLSAQRRLLDLRVFVDALEDVRRTWKTARDVQDRGKTEAGVLAEMERREPDAQRFVQPQRQHADLVLGHLAATQGPDVHLRVELAGHLDPFALLGALQAEATLHVEWLADPSLHRETLVVTGALTAEAVARLAVALLPDAEDWLIDNAAWQAGQRGLAQVVLLHALGAAWNSATPVGGATS